MGWIAYIEGAKYAMLAQMVGNLNATGLQRARGVKLIMKTLIDKAKDRYGEEGGVFAVYSYPGLIRIAKSVGLTEASGELEDKFMYLGFGPHPLDYVND